jgi:heat shock protein HspQ
MTTVQARYTVGQIVRHALFGYRGVIIDADPMFQGTDEWYKKMTSDHPPKDEPWYHILVHGSIHHAYAAESQLLLDNSDEPIEHPELELFFSEFKDGMYVSQRQSN